MYSRRASCQIIHHFVNLFVFVCKKEQFSSRLPNSPLFSTAIELLMKISVFDYFQIILLFINWDNDQILYLVLYTPFIELSRLIG